MIVLEELAQMLADLRLGEYHDDGAAGGTIFLVTLPPEPDEAVAVATYPGGESDSKLAHDTVAVQVRVRGSTSDVRTGARAAQAVYDTLHGLTSQALPGGTWLVLLVATQSGPAYIGRDQLGRHEWTVNLRAELGRRTANRP